MPPREDTKPLVLVVSDKVVRNAIATYLFRAGYAILAAAHGIEASELSRTYPDHIHLLVTDARTPGMSGLDLCKRLMRERPGMRAIIISGGDRDLQEADGIPILCRPFTSTDLIEAVHQLLAPGTGSRGRD
jgi:CheY-like chemotaxis protein